MRLAFLFLTLSYGGYVNAGALFDTFTYWENLRVTWGPDDLKSSRIFAKLPLTETAAESEGFTKISDSCSDGKFLGHRYMKEWDSAAVLLYDVQGQIAGIQFGVPKEDVVNMKTAFSFEKTPAFVHDTVHGQEEFYFLTAYFVDPKTICTTGRTFDQRLDEGLGTGLYLQNGTDPIEDSKAQPLFEKDTSKTLWKKGGCIPRMGTHYWYDMSEDMSCELLFPFTIMYNKGKLTNFAFSTPGYFEFSNRLEHPPQSSRPLNLPLPVPKCIAKEYETAGGFSGMHVYFTVRPWDFSC